MTIDVLLEGDSVPIDEAVFRTLLDNSVAGTYVDYEKALAAGSIPFPALVRLARKGDIPYPLFFAPLRLVEAQVAAKTRKLLAGVSRDTFQIGTREKVELRDVELIVKDLIRKQELLKRHDGSLARNKIVGVLRKPGASPEADAARLMSAIGLTHADLRSCRKKEVALELMIERLEANQVLVARSVQHYMPQRLTHVSFSGMTVRDSKVPFVFLAGGDHGDHQEPVGRTLFTLALMSVLVARRIFKPVTWDGQSTGTDFGREYDVAGAMLMPTERMRALGPASLDDMKSAADEFKVTPSAVTVRAMRLGQISGETARAHLDQLREEFCGRPERKGMTPIRPENAVRKYAGRELSRRMLDVMDSGGMTPKEFCRAVCLNKLGQDQISDLRRAVG
ncbi:hypothetical protein [Georgenia thermotolerans]|uniref:ImmA/IrrE family metallo-endopeptidase n=1 Tax=Georgenia thermotolerans TaxID=527326 RepID=A0A7J5UIT7_9MICO|nr:hypothetical protein [Georgenia thermotolerans]KAE8762288.1 hypothetical protein GB883_20135 [Georgenia thermotolerans]